jgi:hypothetical protein
MDDTLERESYPGELEKLRRVHKMVKHWVPEKIPDTYFICGEGGKKDPMGLPKTISICPAYGLDGFAVYTKTREYSAPGY